MHTIIRKYTGTPSLASELEKRSKDIETEMSSIPGFVAYYLVKTDDGAVSITVCENRAGCDESTTRASKWLSTNLPNLKVNAPQVISGDVAVKFAGHKTPTV